MGSFYRFVLQHLFFTSNDKTPSNRQLRFFPEPVVVREGETHLGVDLVSQQWIREWMKAMESPKDLQGGFDGKSNESRAIVQAAQRPRIFLRSRL